MVVLIFGNDKICREVKSALESAGHSVAMTDEAAQIQKLLTEENGLDMLVIGRCGQAPKDAADIAGGLDYNGMEQMYADDVIEPLKAVKEAAPYLELGACRRICYLNPTMGSNNSCRARSGYAVHMTASAVNMQVNLLFNRLHPQGYSFRLFGVDSMHEPGEQARAACWYFLADRSRDADQKHADENRLVMRDFDGREIPW